MRAESSTFLAPGIPDGLLPTTHHYPPLSECAPRPDEGVRGSARLVHCRRGSIAAESAEARRCVGMELVSVDGARVESSPDMVRCTEDRTSLTLDFRADEPAPAPAAPRPPRAPERRAAGRGGVAGAEPPTGEPAGGGDGAGGAPPRAVQEEVRKKLARPPESIKIELSPASLADLSRPLSFFPDFFLYCDGSAMKTCSEGTAETRAGGTLVEVGAVLRDSGFWRNQAEQCKAGGSSVTVVPVDEEETCDAPPRPEVPADAALEGLPYSELVILASRCGVRVVGLHDAAAARSALRAHRDESKMRSESSSEGVGSQRRRSRSRPTTPTIITDLRHMATPLNALSPAQQRSLQILEAARGRSASPLELDGQRQKRQIVMTLERDDYSEIQGIIPTKPIVAWMPWGLGLEDTTMRLQCIHPGSIASRNGDAQACVGNMNMFFDTGVEKHFWLPVSKKHSGPSRPPG
eukprot:gene7852-biopygen11836